MADRNVGLVPTGTAIPAAGTHTSWGVYKVPRETRVVTWETIFDWGSSGTELDLYLQTSLDGGVTWIDIANHHFTTSDASKVSAVREATALAAGATPTDGTLADNTIVDGLIGDRLRIKMIVTGTYASSTVGSHVVLS